MSAIHTDRMGDVKAMLRIMKPLDGFSTADPIQRKRRLLADLCRLLGAQVGKTPQVNAGISLPPRLRQTLQCLLAGDSEKQAAAKLGLSKHTVHVYVKSLYKRFDVSSRGELLARCLTHSGN